MRITNQMTSNKMLLNINRSMVNVDKLYTMMTSGKKIQVPSDNPIIASRALKFRANISDAEQYQRNTSQGVSWMESSEQAFNNIITIVKNIRDLCVEGASNQFELADKEKMIAEITGLYEQLSAEINVTYAGRYVFSGYRTDFPPTVTQEDANAHFLITQEFGINDIEKTLNYVKLSTTTEPKDTNINRIKLPYSDVQGLTTVDCYNASGQFLYSINVDTKDRNADSDAYEPPVGTAHFIPETGEIMFNDADLAAMHNNGVASMKVNYELEGLHKGELNPIVYFDCTDLNATSKTVTKTAYSGASVNIPDIGVDKPINLVLNNTDGTKSVYTAKIVDLAVNPTPGPDELIYNRQTGELIAGTNVSTAAGAAITANYEYYEIGLNYTMENQRIQFEFGVNTRIDINNLGKDVYTAQLYADLKSLIDMVTNAKPSTEDALIAHYQGLGLTGGELEEAVRTQMNSEVGVYRSVIQKNFSNMLAILDSHQSNISKEHTDLGSRMNRLSFIEARLGEDVVNFNKLMSDNENVDYLEVIMKLNSAESVYSAALQSGSKVIQISLADFIR